MRLYEINQAMLDLIDPETGELLDYEAFASLQMVREQKLENMALWIKDLSAEANAIATEVKALADRKKASEIKADKLKTYLEVALDGMAFKTAKCSVYTRKNPASLEVLDEEKLIQWAEENGHDDCIKYQAPTVDKTALKALIKDGAEVPFAQLVSGQSLVVK